MVEAPKRVFIYDVITRKWIADITSVDETSIEVQAVFNRALRNEGLDTVINNRNPVTAGRLGRTQDLRHCRSTKPSAQLALWASE